MVKSLSIQRVHVTGLTPLIHRLRVIYHFASCPPTLPSDASERFKT